MRFKASREASITTQQVGTIPGCSPAKALSQWKTIQGSQRVNMDGRGGARLWNDSLNSKFTKKLIIKLKLKLISNEQLECSAIQNIIQDTNTT